MKFKIRGEFIPLNQLMKAVDWVSSGSEAHLYIEQGEVYVNGEVVTQKRKKLRPGDIVRFREMTLEMV